MCGIVGGVTTTVMGVVLVIASTVVTFFVVPGIIDNLIINEVVLLDDTTQLDRFIDVPVPLNFTIRLFNISNTEEVLAGGVPVVSEVGPYIYKIYQIREIESLEEDTITYRIRERFEFDPISSYPNTEDDIVTIVNVPYHAILQVAESTLPGLMGVLNSALGGVFGSNNSPFLVVRIRELLFDGIPLCANPGFIGAIACAQIREIGASSKNLAVQDNGTIVFSLLSYKEEVSEVYKAYRGINNSDDLGLIISLNGSAYFNYWVNDEEVPSVCNMVNGTDSGIFNPFINRDKALYAVNTDICRSVELRYQYDTEYEGIPALRFAANEWLLNNEDGCFCLNATTGITKEDGCLLDGATELYSCVGAPLVMSYPHFLFADSVYSSGVIGLNPEVEEHRVFLDLEPNTGTIVRGAKRAQFNIFLRPVRSVTATNNLNTTLTPIVWFEEGIQLPEEFVDELRNRMLMPLNLVSILLPIVIALCCVVFIVGAVIVVRVKLCNRPISK
ncbi:unnamed protein product [Parnassius mnemosyne]|uniref:Sensory neuron membrane protein 2 n=1 Tax=Parnassius mnemosyne TaxID=213953 RepID=A0AAV1L1L3_9NEOP